MIGAIETLKSQVERLGEREFETPAFNVDPLVTVLVRPVKCPRWLLTYKQVGLVLEGLQKEILKEFLFTELKFEVKRRGEEEWLIGSAVVRNEDQIGNDTVRIASMLDGPLNDGSKPGARLCRSALQLTS